MAGAGRHPHGSIHPDDGGGRQPPHVGLAMKNGTGAEKAHAGHDLRRDA
jgi:hypothetical protein